MNPRVAIGLASLIVLGASPGLSQVPGDFPVIGVSQPKDCAEAPLICDVSGYSQTTGVVDFWFFPILYDDAIGARFGITWPSEWTLMEVQICHGRYVQGGITVPGSGITLEFSASQAHQAALRLRMLASTAGVLSLTTDPTTDQFAYQQVNGAWAPYYGEPYGYYVVIGDTDDCSGPWPIYRPCDWCDLDAVPCYPGSIPIPWELELLAGTVFVDTLAAWSASAQSCVAPECGQPPNLPCIGGASSDVPWLTFEALDFRPGPIRIVMSLDARALAAGTYSPRITYGGSPCRLVCGELTLRVMPLAVQAATWGQIKALNLE